MTEAFFPSLVELRQYTLRPGRRDELIELFARDFVAEHERAGAPVLGYFRDLDDPNRFVWLRGFRDHADRPVALAHVYEGELWARRRDTVNALIVDSDDVLQLRPLDQIHGPNGAALVAALVVMLDAPVDDGVAARAGAQLAAQLDEAGGTPLGTLVTDPSPNNYPKLPFREREHALVFMAGFSDVAAGDSWAREMAQRRPPDDLAHREDPVVLRLAPA